MGPMVMGFPVWALAVDDEDGRESRLMLGENVHGDLAICLGRTPEALSVMSTTLATVGMIPEGTYHCIEIPDRETLEEMTFRRASNPITLAVIGTGGSPGACEISVFRLDSIRYISPGQG